MAAVTEHFDGEMFSYDGVLYDNYEDIPFKGKKPYEKGKKIIGDYFTEEWNKIPEPGKHLLKGAAGLVGKGFQYIDKESMGGISGAFKLIDQGMTAGADYVERQTGVYSPLVKAVGEVGIDYLASGGTGKIAKGSKMLANQGDNLVRKLTPPLAYETVPVEGLFTSAVRDATSPGFKPSNMFAATTIRSNLTPSTNLISDPLYDVNTTDVKRTAGGYEGLGHQGLANIQYDPKSPFYKRFLNLRAEQVKGPFKHHHVEDIAFTGRWANTSDFEEVFKELNKLKIYPGDSPKNIIGMMDEGNLFLQTAKTDLAQKLKASGYPGFENIDNYGHLMRKGNESQKKLIDDLFKRPETAGEKPLVKGVRDKLTGEVTPPEIRRVDIPIPSDAKVDWNNFGLDIKSAEFKALKPLEKVAAKRKAYANRFNRLGINRKDIKYDPSTMILSKDHIDTIHYSVYDSPKFTQKRELLKMIEDGSYHTLTAKQKAEKIAEVYKIQKNTSINVAKERLKLIKNHLKETEPIRYRDIYSKDPEAIRQWILNNSSTAANLNWKGAIPDYKTLTRDPGKITKELQTVFSTEIK